MKLIVGLGNPGKQYQRTRHNVGFMMLDSLHDALRSSGISDWSLSKKFNAEIAGLTVNGEKIILAKPMTFMNESGQSVGLLSRFYKITHRDLIVIHDDKDLPLGEVKVQTNRGHAGHNGIRSIIAHIGTQDFLRYRVGVATTKSAKQDTASFVLGKFGIFEKKALRTVSDTVVQEIRSAIGS